MKSCTYTCTAMKPLEADGTSKAWHNAQLCLKEQELSCSSVTIDWHLCLLPFRMNVEARNTSDFYQNIPSIHQQTFIQTGCQNATTKAFRPLSGHH